MKAPLGYVAIHKDKLLPAAFAYEQKVLKDVMLKQQALIDKERYGWQWPWKPKTDIQAAKKLDSELGMWQILQWCVKDAQQDYHQLQTACLMSEGYVYLDVAVVHKLFGE